jgi:hypothetical protein
MIHKRSKYSVLYQELDALRRFETWFIAGERFGHQCSRRLIMGIIRKWGRRAFSMLTVDGGYLFVRLK